MYTATDTDRSHPSDFSPIAARSQTVRSVTAPVAYDCIALTFVRAGSTVLLSEFGERHVTTGDVVMLSANTLCGSVPEDTVTTTTLYLDHDYLVDQVFWQYAAILADRLQANELIESVYAEPAQVLRIGEDRVGYIAPWLDELVALSLDGPVPARFYRTQALLFSVIDVIAPFVKVTMARETPTQRRTTCPTVPRHRAFAPLRAEARRAADLLRDEPDRHWTLPELANSVHLSPSQLGRVFVDAYGKTPIAYLAMIRVERMAALLRDTDQPISLVARRVGWGDSDYAARQFRRCVGMTPRQYRSLSANGTVVG
ncbi:helix-turn-helix transcriptional regulator [Rhodococcus ruber]|uniref:helix-turn-helix transcriptional regulator n=1 Tax=Rhodococcus ruber TaxID=1830 RepID=UPI00296EADA0|nr:AraC family transcriptional regulator [Rhodococcus ruber]